MKEFRKKNLTSKFQFSVPEEDYNLKRYERLIKKGVVDQVDSLKQMDKFNLQLNAELQVQSKMKNADGSNSPYQNSNDNTDQFVANDLDKKRSNINDNNNHVENFEDTRGLS